MRLWDYYTEPPAQQSIIVYKNGDVWEKAEFTTDEINDPDVYLFIQGGTDFRCEPSGWLHDTLVAQGYECTSITEDVYLDGYTDQYPITEA
jgi:hypothetical protein